MRKKQNSVFFRMVIFSLLLSFSLLSNNAFAQGSLFFFANPRPQASLSLDFSPLLVKGLQLSEDDPLSFNFMFDPGQTNFKQEQLNAEISKSIRYFLTALTVPSKDVWVNLSPRQEEKITPKSFGQTEMAKDLLLQDYMLKQITASLFYPEKSIGKKFWNKVYRKMYDRYGTMDIPINTFHKIWITPHKATVYAQGNVVLVVDSHLKVMLEEDDLSLRDQVTQDHKDKPVNAKAKDMTEENRISASIIREIFLPELEKEINQGENFSQLRQIYHAMILATWFKKYFKETVLNRVYVNKNKTAGIHNQDAETKEKIYKQYLDAMRLGVFKHIKEEYDPKQQELVSREYISGGFHGNKIDEAMAVQDNLSVKPDMEEWFLAQGSMRFITKSSQPNQDHAILSEKDQLEKSTIEKGGLVQRIADETTARDATANMTFPEGWNVFDQEHFRYVLEMIFLKILKNRERDLKKVREAIGEMKSVSISINPEREESNFTWLGQTLKVELMDNQTVEELLKNVSKLVMQTLKNSPGASYLGYRFYALIVEIKETPVALLSMPKNWPQHMDDQDLESAARILAKAALRVKDPDIFEESRKRFEQEINSVLRQLRDDFDGFLKERQLIDAEDVITIEAIPFMRLMDRAFMDANDFNLPGAWKKLNQAKQKKAFDLARNLKFPQEDPVLNPNAHAFAYATERHLLAEVLSNILMVDNPILENWQEDILRANDIEIIEDGYSRKPKVSFKENILTFTAQNVGYLELYFLNRRDLTLLFIDAIAFSSDQRRSLYAQVESVTLKREIPGNWAEIVKVYLRNEHIGAAAMELARFSAYPEKDQEQFNSLRNRIAKAINSTLYDMRVIFNQFVETQQVDEAEEVYQRAIPFVAMLDEDFINSNAFGLVDVFDVLRKMKNDGSLPQNKIEDGAMLGDKDLSQKVRQLQESLQLQRFYEAFRLLGEIRLQQGEFDLDQEKFFRTLKGQLEEKINHRLLVLRKSFDVLLAENKLVQAKDFLREAVMPLISLTDDAFFQSTDFNMPEAQKSLDLAIQKVAIRLASEISIPTHVHFIRMQVFSYTPRFEYEKIRKNIIEILVAILRLEVQSDSVRKTQEFIINSSPMRLLVDPTIEKTHVAIDEEKNFLMIKADDPHGFTYKFSQIHLARLAFADMLQISYKDLEKVHLPVNTLPDDWINRMENYLQTGKGEEVIEGSKLLAEVSSYMEYLNSAQLDKFNSYKKEVEKISKRHLAVLWKEFKKAIKSKDSKRAGRIVKYDISPWMSSTDFSFPGYEAFNFGEAFTMLEKLPQPTLYDILDIAQNALFLEVAMAYNAKKDAHQSGGYSPDSYAYYEFQEVQEAYAVLNDAKARRIYDKALADTAMLGQKNPGGIILDSRRLDIEELGEGINLLDIESLDGIQNIPIVGAEIIIFHIAPLDTASFLF